MFQWRKILGLITLAIAIAGPLPLWWHHALCHSNLSCSTSSGHAHVDCNQNETHSHTHSAGKNSHSSDSSACTSPARNDNLIATSVVEPSLHSHDCWVCFQLSQSASAGFDIALAIGQAVSHESAISCPQFQPATVCGLFSPRGPPSIG